MRRAGSCSMPGYARVLICWHEVLEQAVIAREVVFSAAAAFSSRQLYVAMARAAAAADSLAPRTMLTLAMRWRRHAAFSRCRCLMVRQIADGTS